VKAVVLALARFLVRLFYRRIEVSGLEHLPRERPVLLVANHTNGLVDPMVVLAAFPRPVVFVAKSTLWKIPVLRSILDLVGCVPVVRRGEEEKNEGETASKGNQAGGSERNEGSFLRLAAALDSGSCVLIFPEGRSHSDPRLSEIRTGAARVLLLSKASPVVLPVGLWFTKKEEFRSDVLVKVGPQVALEPHQVEEAVEAWTQAIGAALEAVTLNADSWGDHEVVAAVDALYGRSVESRFLEGEEGRTAGDGSALERSLRVRRLLTAARETLEKTHPGEVSRVARRVLAFDHLLRKFSLTPAALDAPPPAATIAWHTLKALGIALLGFPVAVLGVVAWWVPYRLCGVIANRLPGAREHRDQISLYKLLAGCVLFPLFLVLECAAIWAAAGPRWAAAAAVLLPFAGISSLLFLEYTAWREGQARDLLALLVAPRAIERLKAERDALVSACDRLAERFGGVT
jgi:1-acyl-sn-glycerol-3-phosphate acyltransferase